MENFVLSIYLCLFFLSIVNGLNDVTTAYEINPVKSDREGITCNVKVHVQPKDVELPLFNIDGNGPVAGTNKIPPLFQRLRISKWTPTRSWVEIRTIIEERYQDYFNMNLPPLGHCLKAHENFKMFKLESYDRGNISKDIFGKDEMDELYNSTHAFPFNTLGIMFMRNELLLSIQLYWDNNESHFIEIEFRNGTHVSVCYHNDKIDCKESKFSFGFEPDCKSCLIIPTVVFITLYGELIISDVYSGAIFQTHFYLPEGVTKYNRVSVNNYTGLEANFYLYQGRPTHIVSPWLNMETNTSAFIFYFALPGHTVNASLEDQTTKAITQLSGVELDRVHTSAGLERVLTKVSIPRSSTGKKRIRVEGDTFVVGNIWESTELDQHKEQGRVRCRSPWIESYMMHIYNTLERGGTKDTEPVDTCFNGGRLKNAACACPPGFAGNQCEQACGRNRFGQTCSYVCSNSSNDCKGMILCTPDYGCTCAPGYYGDQCMEQCQQGTYEADCVHANLGNTVVPRNHSATHKPTLFVFIILLFVFIFLLNEL